MKTGLSSAAAQKKLEEFGYNEIAEQNKTTPFQILLRQIQGNFVLYLLIFSAVLSIFAGKSTTAYTISIVIILVITVGFFLEYKAEKAIETLKRLVTDVSTVIRDGKELQIPSREIVPGDIILLKNGERVPADATILESHNLQVNESVLTGESVEVEKNAPHSSQQSDDTHTLFMGTYVVNGRGMAQVFHTGMHTKFGSIAKMITVAEKEMPLQRKINDITRYMIIVSLTFSFLTGLLMILRSESITSVVIAEILMVVMALSVSAVPEGLPVVLVTTLANGALRMAKRHAIVNRMSVIGTIGETTVICSDKTGTITKGEMTVKKIYVNDRYYDVSGSGYDKQGDIIHNGKVQQINDTHPLFLFMKAAVINNDATIQPIEASYAITGTPTEASLLVLAAKAHVFRQSFAIDRVHEIPFSSARKMMSILCSDNIVYVKGAPEAVIHSSTFIQKEGEIIELSSNKKNELLQITNELSKQAYRTLALAYKSHTDKDTYTEDRLIFLGLVGIEDPPREEVFQAIQTAHMAGIQVKMITGDNPETAKAIATQVGLPSVVMEGKEIDTLTDSDLADTVKRISVFARVRPEHKVRIVKALKANNELVAMTGDGVNDAPALKESHVGIAMGVTGTDVSRAVADITLKDDNFATIVSAIKEGRGIFRNIQTFVSYQLSINLAQLFIVFMGVLVGPTLGWHIPIFVALQILFVNIITDSLPAIAIGLTPTGHDVMKRKPIRTSIITNKLLFFIGMTGTATGLVVLLVFYFSQTILSLEHIQASSLAFLSFIIIAIMNAFCFQSLHSSLIEYLTKKHNYLLLAACISLLATLVIFYSPLQQIFELSYVPAYQWSIAISAMISITLFFELVKILRNRKIF